MKHEGYNPTAGNSSYQYKYNGKELQTDSGMYDYGARFYMPDLGRWGVVDPLSEKYRRMTPYSYAGNNPAMFVDYDGRDFGMYIDLKSGTVIIKATYYAVASDMNSANTAVKTWNDMSGKFNYLYKGPDGKEVSLKINFQLTAYEISPKEGESRYDAISNALNSDKSGEGNTYKTVKDGHFDDGEKGITKLGKVIDVLSSESGGNTGTGAHEIGHTLNIKDGIGVMGTRDSTVINKGHIKEILSVIGGTPTNPTKSEPRADHNAKIHIQNNNLKTDEDYRNFREGAVKSAN